MENSINNQSGGTAAITSKNNPNKQPQPNIIMNHNKDTSVPLKEAAAKFECAASSLKNNIKSGNLSATQANEKAPYMVLLSDVERLLRNTPGIASIFHPEKKNPTKEACPKTPPAPVPSPDQQSGNPVHIKGKQSTLIVDNEIKSDEEKSPANASLAETVMSDNSVPSGIQSEHPAKRRRRRRGRRSNGESPVNPGIKSMALNALVGTTPQERLRITACLNELASLVASA